MLTAANRARAVSTSRLLASRKTSEEGSFTSFGSSRPGGPVSRAWSMMVSRCVLPSRETAILLRSASRVDRSRSSTSPFDGFNSVRQLQLEEGLLVVARRFEAPTALKVVLRRANPGSVEGVPDVFVVRVFLERSRVFGDGAVVVLLLFCNLRAADRAARDAR